MTAKTAPKVTLWEFFQQLGKTFMALKDNRAIGVVQLNQHNLQVVIGPQVQSVKDEMAGLMHTVQA